MEKPSFKYLVQYTENSWGVKGTRALIVRNENHFLELCDAQTMRRYEVAEIEGILHTLSTHQSAPHEALLIETLIAAEMQVIKDIKENAMKRLSIQKQSIEALYSGMKRLEKRNKELQTRLFAYEIIAVVIGLLAICAIIRLFTYQN